MATGSLEGLVCVSLVFKVCSEGSGCGSNDRDFGADVGDLVPGHVASNVPEAIVADILGCNDLCHGVSVEFDARPPDVAEWALVGDGRL